MGLLIYVLDKYDKVVTVLCTDSVLSGGIQVISAKTKEVNGGASTVEVTIDSTHSDTSLISDTEHQSLLFRNSDGEWQQYYIAEIEDNHTQFLTKTLFGESASQEVDNRFCTEDVTVSDLDGSPQALISYCLAPSRWVLGDCDLEGDKIHLLESKHKSVGELLQECASLYSADYRFRIEVDPSSESKILGRYVDFKKTLTIDKGKVFSIGKDIVSIKRSIDCSNVKTAIIPVMAESGEEESQPISIIDVEWSVTNGDPTDKPKGQDWVGNNDTLQLWGYYDKATGTMNHRFMKAEFSEATTPEQMITQAWNVLNMNSVPKVTYEVNVVDLYRMTKDADLIHEYVRNGEKVRIIDKDFSPALIVEANIVEIERDLLDPENDLVVIGNHRNTIADSFTKIETELNDKLNIQDLGSQIVQLRENTYYVNNTTDMKINITPRVMLQVAVVLSNATEVMCMFSATVKATQECNLTMELQNNGITFPFKPVQTLKVGYNVISFSIPLFQLDTLIENRLELKGYTDVGEVMIEVQQCHMVLKGSQILIKGIEQKFTGGEFEETLYIPEGIEFKFTHKAESDIRIPYSQDMAMKQTLSFIEIDWRKE